MPSPATNKYRDDQGDRSRLNYRKSKRIHGFVIHRQVCSISSSFSLFAAFITYHGYMLGKIFTSGRCSSSMGRIIHTGYQLPPGNGKPRNWWVWISLLWLGFPAVSLAQACTKTLGTPVIRSYGSHTSQGLIEVPIYNGTTLLGTHRIRTFGVLLTATTLSGNKLNYTYTIPNITGHAYWFSLESAANGLMSHLVQDPDAGFRTEASDWTFNTSSMATPSGTVYFLSRSWTYRPGSTTLPNSNAATGDITANGTAVRSNQQGQTGYYTTRWNIRAGETFRVDAVYLNRAAEGMDAGAFDLPDQICIADLSTLKTNNTNQVVSGTSTTYSVTFSNSGPDAAHGAVVQDTPNNELTSCAATCSPNGGATCPTPASSLMQATGATITAFPSSSSLQFDVTCTIR